MKIAAIIAITAAVTTVAAPAFAQPTGTFGKAKVTYNQKANTYCLKEVLPSTIVPQITCRTVQDWADAGLKITRKPAVQLAQR
ncbi:MAG: hypothetical protein PSY12_01560 [bacterium]|nr:hypothetical protein [bacterium]